MEQDSGLYSLKWSDFRTDFTGGFQYLLKEEAMVDVTLAVEGKCIQAHKVVLSVCSPYFMEIFKINPCKHPVVYLKDVSYHILSYMLDFMYKGEVGVKMNDLQAFINLAEGLQIKGLRSENIAACEPHVKRDIISKLRKKRISQPTSELDSEDNESEPKLIRSRRHLKRRSKHDRHDVFHKEKQEEIKKRRETSEVEERMREADENEDSDCSPLVKLIIGKTDNDLISDVKSDIRDATQTSNDDNNLGEDDNDSENFPNDDFDTSAEMFQPDAAVEPSEQGPQGGVDYQMIQTKRGRDMLLYDGYTFTQNRMCKDGMRWQCSFHKCKAFCRMSSAGWLTPYKTNHDHERPSTDEIKRRILRTELKARAQSSGATPGEIIRNALPAEEYQTPDQRACYTRCIQRFRKSLLRKNEKEPSNSWSGTQEADLLQKVEPEQVQSWHMPMREEHKHSMVDAIWPNHPQPVQLSEEDKHRQLVEQKDHIHTKLGAYAI